MQTLKRENEYGEKKIQISNAPQKNETFPVQTDTIYVKLATIK